MNGEQAYKFAYANAKRNADGGIVEESLVELVARAVDFDADKERLGLAQRIVSRRKRPGQTEPDGKVCIPGLEPYAWEPHRLIADDDGNVVENREAREVHKKAEARRAALAAESAQERARREQWEADLIAEWTVEQQAAGRDPRTLTFEKCLSEAGVLDGGDVA
jgi:hypothetical protein